MKVRTLIGPLSKGMGGEGIMQILTSAPRGYRSGIVPERIEDWPSVLERLSCQTFDVLIAEFDETCAPSIESLFLLQPTLSIIELDLVSRTTKVHVLDVGSEMLMALAHFLAKWVGLTADDYPNVICTPPPPPRYGHHAHQYAEPYCDAAEQLDDLREWLDLKLSLAVGRTETEACRGEGGGWAIDPGRARRALGERAAALGVAELRTAWEEVDQRLAERTEATDPRECRLPLGDVERAFDLDEVERQMFRLALAPDIHASYAQLYGVLQDNLAQPRPTPSLLAELIDCAGPPWSVSRRMTGDRPFARYGLIAAAAPDPGQVPLSQTPVSVPVDLVDFVLSGDGLAGPGGCALVQPSDCWPEAGDPAAAPALAAIESAAAAGLPPPIVVLAAAPGEQSWLGEQLAATGRAVVVGSLPSGLQLADLKAKVLAWSRWARLNEAMLIVSGLDEIDEEARSGVAEWLVQTIAPLVALLAMHGKRIHPVALGATAGGIVQIRRGLATRQERAALWRRACADRGIALPPATARDLAATYAFGRAQVEAAVALAFGSGRTLFPATVGAALKDAALQVSRASAPASVRRVETMLGWDDIVLPPSVKDELRSISSHTRHAETVWDEWGFGDRIPYGQGIAALFAGPSGTGKTMAAQIIAREMGAALFQVDLSKIVSKYIGETEKALDAIFDSAEAAGAILEFGEADALFGKRSEVKDSHDRYANVEVSYLLQRIESYRGIALLTTNLKQNLDPAFLRRLRFIIDFPLPNAEQRLAIWTRMFPADAPLAADVDLGILARQLPLSGGSIEKSVLNAAFKAAESGGCIEMRHIVAATRRELAKLGMENAARSLTRLVPGELQAGAEG